MSDGGFGAGDGPGGDSGGPGNGNGGIGGGWGGGGNGGGFGAAGGPGGDGSAGDNGWGGNDGGVGAAMGEGGFNSAVGLGGWNGSGFGPSGYGYIGDAMGEGGFNSTANMGGWMGSDMGFGELGADSLGSMFGPASNMSAVATATSTPAELGFVDSMTESERARKIVAPVAQSVVNQQLTDALGPLGPFVGNIAGSMVGTQTPEAAARSNFSAIAGMIGTALAGPVGGMIGAALGRSASSSGPTGPGRGSGTGNGNGVMDIGQLIGGLGQMYLNSQASNDAKRAQRNISSGIDAQLADMFGPNSAYAQQLRQQLERRDAAGGRRSQYGAREVELQAKLAEMASRTMPSLMNAQVNREQQALAAQQLRRQRQAQTLSTLYGIGRQSGFNDYIGRTLGGMFPGNQYSSYGSAGGPGGDGSAGGNFYEMPSIPDYGMGGDLYNSTAPSFDYVDVLGFE